MVFHQYSYIIPVIFSLFFLITATIWGIYDKKSIIRMALRLPFFIMFVYLVSYNVQTTKMAIYSIDLIKEAELLIITLAFITILGPVEIWERFTGRKLRFSKAK
tara:strand:- start:160 stop:471 length:312 start_codon:yes stop_codon:yes gene_type:complete